MKRAEALVPERARDWQRARRPEHKAERRQAIVAAATSLLDEGGLEAATLSEIARRAGLSKANCYRYFESREAILLAIALEEARDWAAALNERLAPLAGSGDVDAVARVYARTTAEHPRLCALVSALSSVLERNVGAETVAEFKRAFHPLNFGSAEALCAALPGLAAPQAEAFLLFCGLGVAGTWPNANPAPVVAEVLARESFASMRIEFEPTLFAHARVVLLGLLAEARG